MENDLDKPLFSLQKEQVISERSSDVHTEEKPFDPYRIKWRDSFTEEEKK